jgi:hypothetical protein
MAIIFYSLRDCRQASASYNRNAALTSNSDLTTAVPNNYGDVFSEKNSTRLAISVGGVGACRICVDMNSQWCFMAMHCPVLVGILGDGQTKLGFLGDNYTCLNKKKLDMKNKKAVSALHIGRVIDKTWCSPSWRRYLNWEVREESDSGFCEELELCHFNGDCNRDRRSGRWHHLCET